MLFEEYKQYLQRTKKMSKNSVDAYLSDISDFILFIEAKGVTSVKDVSNTEAVSFVMSLKQSGKTSSTINRKLASVRAYFYYLMNLGEIQVNPFQNVKAPKVEKKDLEYLSLEEIELLLDCPDQTLKGKRDRALLEVMYATGLRVNEIIGANVKDVNLRIGFFGCPGTYGKARIVPMGRQARKVLEDYIFDVRPQIVKENLDEEALFVNYNGVRMTRQGLWKILKEYGAKAGIEKKLTPHTLRNSFAVHMIQNGADLKSIQELLGHEDLAATQIYLSVAKNKIKDVYDRCHPRA